MKKLIKRKEIEEVAYFDELKSGDIVGVEYEDVGKRAYLFDNEEVLEINTINTSVSMYNNDVEDLQEDFLDAKQSYKFDTMKELFKWMSE